MWCLVTNVLEECAAPIFSVEEEVPGGIYDACFVSDI
jgi:hypothetical protein